MTRGMSASLKSKLRLTGLTPQTKNLASQSAGIISPRRPDGGTSLDCKIKPREASYDMYNNRRDDRGLHSDSSSEASEPYKDVTRTSDKNPPLKFNRAFSLRRARLGCDEPVSTTVEKKKVNRASSAGASSSARKGTLGASKSYQSVDNASVSSPRNYGYGSPRGIASPSQNVGGSKGTPQSDNFDRTDGGRYSLRLPRSGSSSIGLSKSPSKSSIHKKEGPNNRKGATRSNSTLSSKEVDFQNWKRRKNYDPMKAAAEGRKKQVEKKQKNAQPSAQINSDNRSPSPPGSLLRSASFHGTEGVMPHVRWTRKPNNAQPQYTSEDDGPYSLEEEVGPHPSPMHGSPLHRSPTSPHQLCQSPIRHPQVRGSRRPSLGLSDEGEPQYQSGLRKVSLEESGSEGKRSPLNPGARTGSSNSATGAGRPKTKMEALDNLVISTIHSLSVKYDEEGDRAALLEEVLSHLSESDQSLTSGQTRSTSRELAGILRNLKKIEHALEVIDKVIIVGEEDYRDDDVDYVPTEWVEESDY
ncbi:hypothetical protein Avbf_07214 [Armadillidium vulgare]|nr:hypothetical protein Avbf_07214 [Armadillidium vulgare]